MHDLLRLILFVIIFLIYGCTPGNQRRAMQEVLHDGHYDSEYPSRPTSGALKQISKSVFQVSSLAFYHQFNFSEAQKITKLQFNAQDIRQSGLAVSDFITEKPAAGTATVIYYQNLRVGLLTCAHTISSEDTIYHHYIDVNGFKTPYIKRVEIKLRQTINVIGLYPTVETTILAVDKEADLAILGTRLSQIPEKIPIVFGFPLGSADELEMGTFVYLIGFPHGKKMVISSIVSTPLGSKNNFIVNATMYNGISGGLVLALRDGVPNFELVGIVNALSAHRKIILKPQPNLTTEDVMPTLPYQGKIYLDEQVDIVEGISFAIPAETIESFIKSNRSKLDQLGYSINLKH